MPERWIASYHSGLGGVVVGGESRCSYAQLSEATERSMGARASSAGPGPVTGSLPVARRVADFDKALPAIGRNGQRGMIAEVRQFESAIETELEQLRPSLEIVDGVIYRNLWHRLKRST